MGCLLGCAVRHTPLADSGRTGAQRLFQTGSREKKEYLALKPGKEVFWKMSFGRVATARKAVLRRGWYPPNYVLLDNPNLIALPKDVDNSSIKDIETESDNTNLASVLDNQQPFYFNLNGKKMNMFLDHLVQEAAKGEGRKRRFKEQQESNKKRKEGYDLLANITTVSSGQLAINDIWTLGPNVFQKVKEKEEMEECKKASVEAKKQIQQQKRQQDLQMSYAKYVNYRHLIRHVHRPGDDAVATKTDDLRKQWEKYKSRFVIFLSTPPTVITENNFVGTECTQTNNFSI
jgi:hypothetical protein